MISPGKLISRDRTVSLSRLSSREHTISLSSLNSRAGMTSSGRSLARRLLFASLAVTPAGLLRRPQFQATRSTRPGAMVSHIYSLNRCQHRPAGRRQLVDRLSGAHALIPDRAQHRFEPRSACGRLAYHRGEDAKGGGKRGLLPDSYGERFLHAAAIE